MVHAGRLMGKHGSLTYKRPNNKIVVLEENLHLRMMVINSTTTRIRFTDVDGEHLPFHQDAQIRQLRHGVAVDDPEDIVDNDVFVNRYCSYVVMWRGNSLFRLEDQGQQAIQGGDDLVIFTV